MIANAVTHYPMSYMCIKRYLCANYNIPMKSPYTNKTIKKLLNAPDGEPKLYRKSGHRLTFIPSKELLAKVGDKEEHIDYPLKVADPALARRGKRWTAEEDDELKCAIGTLCPDEGRVEYVKLHDIFHQIALVHKRTDLSIKLRLLYLVHEIIIENTQPVTEKGGFEYDYIKETVERCAALPLAEYVIYLEKNPKLKMRDIIIEHIIQATLKNATIEIGSIQAS